MTEVGRSIEIGAVQGQGGILKATGTTFRTGLANALLLFVPACSWFVGYPG